MSQQEPDAPSSVEGDPVVEVQPATEPLTPDEVKEAQQRDQESGEIPE